MNQPDASPDIENVYLKPPVAIDATAPPFANEVRVIHTQRVLTVHAYYVSPTRLDGARQGSPQPGVQVRGNSVLIEAEPLARFALSLPTAADLALIIARAIAPTHGQEHDGLLALYRQEIMKALTEAPAQPDDKDAEKD